MNSIRTLIFFGFVLMFLACNTQNPDKKPEKAENKEKQNDFGIYSIQIKDKNIYLLEETSGVLIIYDPDTEQSKIINLTKVVKKEGYFHFPSGDSSD